MQIQRRRDRHIGADDLPHLREQDAVRVVLLGRQPRAVRADIDGVDRQLRFEAALDRVEQLDKEGVLDRTVRLGHRQCDTDRRPGAGGVHRRDKARRFRQHARRRRARVLDDRVAFEIGASEKMRLGRHRRELVALDREAEECHARRGWAGHDGTGLLQSRLVGYSAADRHGSIAMDLPETRYAKSGDCASPIRWSATARSILVFVPGFRLQPRLASGKIPGRAYFFSRLAAFSRLIVFDKRGTGLSDRMRRDCQP